MASVQVAVMDGEDNIWWEMPEATVDRLMVADSTVELAQIARMLKDHIRDADEKINENIRRESGSSET